MLDVHSPYDLSLIKSIPLNGTADMEKALETADKIYRNRSGWLKPHVRIEILEKLSGLMKENIESLIKTAVSEGGKPYADTRVELLRAINGVKLAAEHIGQLKGQQIPMGLTKASEKRLAFTIIEPIGPVAAISAFNHPVNLIIHQVITAIAAGCPVIIKPARTTPLSCIKIAELLEEAGLPEGWCQVMVCGHSDAEKLVSDPRIKYLTFIGSAEIGWKMRKKLAPGTHCAMEHGGAAPVIVEPDADLAELVPALTKGGFYHAGQVCVSVQKIYIHQDIIDAVAKLLVETAHGLSTGDPLNPSTDVGPLIDPAEVDRVEKWVKEAVDEGAELLCGGKRISDTCYEPSILLNPAEQSKVSKQEVFGPVICLYSYKNRDEAVKRANALPFCFQSAVFSKNIDIALDTAGKLDSMAVMINDHTAFRVDWMPFGGSGESGIGIGGIPYTMREMSREKLTVIKSSLLP